MVEMDNYWHINWDECEPMKQAQITRYMMRDFHGKSLVEIHGEENGKELQQKLGITNWDKHHDYKILLQVIDGKAEFSISGKSYHLNAGEMIIMPADKPHAVKAIDMFKMMLVMIKA